MTVIDSDQHLVEHRGLWYDHADPADRDLVVELVDDELGWTRLVWHGQTLGLAEVQEPGQTAAIGARHELMRAGHPNPVRYDEALPADHWDPKARAARLASLGLDATVLFPNFGLFWERRLSESLPAPLRANMTAWNRWCTTVVADGDGRLHPVAHLTLRDLDWFEREVVDLARAGVRLAMVAPALVDGRPLSHPDLDRGGALLVDHQITPVFHVADQPRPFDDGWYTDAEDTFVPTLDAVFIWTAAALAVTDLITNGVFERHPDLRLGIVELSAIWVPQFLLMLDGGVEFTTKLNGRPPAALSRRPSEYLLEHVRVSSFAYELPERIVRQLGGRDILMACSDYPHTEGTADPLGEYERAGRGLRPADEPAFFEDNVRFLLPRRRLTAVAGVETREPWRAVAPEPFAAFDRVEGLAGEALRPAILDPVRVAVSANLLNPSELERSPVTVRDAPDDRGRACVAFAEQFVVDVSAITDAQRAALDAAIGADAFTFVQCLYVIDVFQRGRIVISRLFDEPFGAPPAPPAPAPAEGDLWAALEAFMRVVAQGQALDPLTTELVRLRGARIHRCRLCQSRLSVRALDAAGGSSGPFDALDDYEASDLSERHKTALRLTDAIVTQPAFIDDALRAQIADQFTAAEITEIVLDVVRNAANKIAVAFAADAAEVDGGVQYFDVDRSGEVVADTDAARVRTATGT